MKLSLPLSVNASLRVFTTGGHSRISALIPAFFVMLLIRTSGVLPMLCRMFGIIFGGHVLKIVKHNLKPIHTERMQKQEWNFSYLPFILWFFSLFFDLFPFCSCFRLVWIDPKVVFTSSDCETKSERIRKVGTTPIFEWKLFLFVVNSKWQYIIYFGSDAAITFTRRESLSAKDNPNQKHAFLWSDRTEVHYFLRTIDLSVLNSRIQNVHNDVVTSITSSWKSSLKSLILTQPYKPIHRSLTQGQSYWSFAEITSVMQSLCMSG